MSRRISAAALVTTVSLIATGAATAAPTWSAPIPFAPQPSDGPNARAFYPAIAENAKGDGVIVWSTQNGIKAMTREHGGPWSPPTLIVEEAYFGRGAPSIDANGTAIVSYTAYSDFEPYVQVRRHRPGAAEWDDSVTLSDPARVGLLHDASVAFDRDGNAYAVWDAYERGGSPTHYRIQFSTCAAGSAWTKPRDIVRMGTDFPHDVALAADSDGNLIVAWVQARRVVEAAFRSAATGAWDAPTELDSSAVDAHEVRVAFDGAGNATAVWNDSLPGALSVVQSAYRPAGETWRTRRPLTNRPDAFSDVQLAVEPGGTAVAVWGVTPPGNALRSIGAATRRGGGSWGEWTTLFRSNTEYPVPALAADEHGNAIVVWGSDLAGLRAALRPAASGRWLPPVEVAPVGIGADVAIDDLGHATALSGSGTLYRTELNGAGPLLDVHVPQYGPVGAPTTFYGIAVPWASPLVDPRPIWDFGEGAYHEGSGTMFERPFGSHVYKREGVYTVTTYALDHADGTTTAQREISITKAAVGNTRRPKIQGMPRVGATLRCSPGTWVGAGPMRFDYAWLRDREVVPTSARTIRLARRDAHRRFVCVVTAANRLNTEAATSASVRIRR